MPLQATKFLAMAVWGHALMCSMAAAPNPQCLVIRPSTTSSIAQIQGTIVNQCGKPITAYMVAAEVFYINGRSEAIVGAGSDFVRAFDAPPGSGLGAVRPGEERVMHGWEIALSEEKQNSIAKITFAVCAVIFSDSTALGDSTLIERTFANRRDDLRELRFWQNALAKYKPDLLSGGTLAQLTELANVPEQRLMSAGAQEVRQQLAWFDAVVQKGTVSRADAINTLEQYFARITKNLEANSARVKEE